MCLLAQFSCLFTLLPNPPSHVVGHVDGVELVGQEGVPQVHALLLPSGVDGDDPRVHDDHHPHDEVVLLQHHVGDQGHQVQRVLLRATQLRHHHQQVGPREHRAVCVCGGTERGDGVKKSCGRPGARWKTVF